MALRSAEGEGRSQSEAAVPYRDAHLSFLEAQEAASADALDRAVNDLRRRAPDLSAGTPIARWQRFALIVMIAVLPVATFVSLPGVSYGLSLGLAVPFFLIVLIRMAALWHLTSQSRPSGPPSRVLADEDLPHYSVLVAVYREAEIAPSLVAAMSRLDYPSDRLEIIFITEADDEQTRYAIASAGLAPFMRIAVVPCGLPKTKPRALNYALQGARGDLICVFDAEDVPEPDQLRRVAEVFSASDDRLACVQARLSISNMDESGVACQFGLEYAALFAGILPALSRFGLPLPLGGTSNHFRRDALVDSGGWDAFNVTEDADLGIRLARLGYEATVLPSVTWEDAPSTWRVWIKQRTRWQKGWMQTYLVHMRKPSALWTQLGAWRFFGFQVTFGGMLLSALVHPWFYGLIAAHLLGGGNFLPADSLLWWLCGFNLIAGYISAGVLVAMTVPHAAPRRSAMYIVLLPIYWLAISLAAYRAVFDLIRRPHYWEKTPHAPPRERINA
jgi:cellulose synthase/poly-beta-1,6-N-acetylglucosamine synthase-like glycosyltransferase